MLTIKEVKNATGIYNVPKNIHVNKDICFDWRLFDALVNPDYENNRDYKYDFDIFLPTYGINLQRPYVWEHCQQNEFILSILLEKPIDSFVVIQYSEDNSRSNVTNYVIDGKQRLLTIQKFGKNEFPIVVNGKEYYFKDFDKDLQLFFERRVNFLTGVVYYTYPDIPASDDLKITLFNFYNFAGTPQTEEHKKKLQNLLNKSDKLGIMKEKLTKMVDDMVCDIPMLISKYDLSEDKDYFEVFDEVLREEVGFEDVNEPEINEFINTLLFKLDDKIQEYWGSKS